MNKEWFFALIPFGLGMVFFTVGLIFVRRTRALRRSGAKAYGHVVRLSTSAGGHGTLYHPVVRWITSDGHTVEQTAAVGKSWIVHFRPGTRVLIHYDPRDPGRMIIEGYSGGSEWLFCLLGGSVMVVTITVCVVAAF
ncbi:DUF3592 domain-containing protein [Nocardia sp. NPDC047654]|uniref:DUF3592 domain-containing protein n=1 Tax=Nocardia sp. NPDC047654 TaxID=3364314 RepID=UPI00371C6A9E